MVKLLRMSAAVMLFVTVSIGASAEDSNDQGIVRATAEDLDVEILKSDSEYVNHIYLITPREEFYIGSDDEFGKFVSLPRVEIGEELIFEIRVHDSGRDTGVRWRSGPPSRNSDNWPHALVAVNDDGSMTVAFEDVDAADWAAAYEPNYSDAVFRLTPR